MFRKKLHFTASADGTSRRPDNYVSAILFALVAAGMAWLFPAASSPVGSTISALFIYFGVLAFSIRAGCLMLCLYLALGLVSTQPFETTRVTIFAAVLFASSAGAVGVPPFISNLLAWILLLLLPILTKNPIAAMPFNHSLWTRIVLEWVGVLAIEVFRLFPRARRFLGGYRTSPNLKTFLVHSMALIVIGSAICVGIALLVFTPATAGEIFEEASGTGPVLLLIIATVLIIPSIAGSLVAMTLEHYLSQLKLIATGDNRLQQQAKKPLPILEFEKLRRDLQQQVARLREQIRSGEDERHRLTQAKHKNDLVIREREQMAQSLMHLMDCAPWGAIACTTRGVIILANSRFCSLLGLSGNSLAGQNIAVLNSNHLWNREIALFLNQQCREAAELPEGTVLNRATSSANGQYLELKLVVTKASAIDNKARKNAAEQDVALILFVHRLPDLRDFHLRLLSPSDFELLGCQAVEKHKIIRQHLSDVSSTLNTASTALTGLVDESGIPTIQTPKGTDCAIGIREAANFADLCRAELETLQLRSTASPAESDADLVNLSRWLLNGVSYISELVAYTGQIKLFHLEEGESVSRKTLDETSSIEDDVFIQASTNEIMRLMSYLLSLLRWILAKTQHLELTLDYEEISQQGASFLVGSRPGRYVRLALEHRGQSITPQIMNPKYQLSQMSNENSLEAAFTLFSLEVKRLRGFLSLQSSSMKGTSLTVYLPAQREQENFADMIRRTPSPTPTRSELCEILLVAPQNTHTNELNSMLGHLGYQATVLPPNVVQDDLGEPLDFGGTGFGALDDLESSDPLFDSGHRSDTDYKRFGLVVLDIDSSTPDTAHLVRLLRKNAPQAPALLVGTTKRASHSGFEGHVILRPPFDINSLDNAIREARRRSEQPNV